MIAVPTATPGRSVRRSDSLSPLPWTAPLLFELFLCVSELCLQLLESLREGLVVLEQTYALLKDWFWGFYQARTEDDLETAGQHFAAGVAKGGVFLAQLVVTHKALKFASKKLVARFPPPEKLRTRFGEEARRVQERRSERKTESEPEGKQRVALRRVQELGQSMKGYGGFELGRDVSGRISDASTAGIVLVGLLGVVTVGVVVAVVTDEDERRKR